MRSGGKPKAPWRDPRDVPTRETVWSPVERSFRAADATAEPHLDRTLSVTFSHQSGADHVVPGFWDGGATWRVRFAPTRPGRWTWETDPDPYDPDLDRAGEFVAADYDGPNRIRRHGFLRADGRGFAHDDGTPFFWLADTAWSAGAKATPEEWREYVRARAAQGFTAVQVNTLPQHDASQPHDRLPFGNEWDLDRPDPDYFAALDDLVAACHDAGLVPALVALWCNYATGANEDWDVHRHDMDEGQAARWGRYLAARYGAYGPAWLVSGDTDFTDEAMAVYDAAAEAVRDGVTHPLLTLHMHSGITTSEDACGRDWLDFHCYQSGHHEGDRQRDAFRLAERTRDRDDRDRPVVNGEPPYEGHEYFESEDGVRVSREAARRAAWWSVLAGASAGVTYGGHGVWQWHRRGERFPGASRTGMPVPWRETLAFPGARDYGRLRSLCERYEFAALEPRQEWVDEPTVRAAELPADDVVLAYAPAASDLSLDRDAGVGDADATWVDPATGRRVPADVGSGGSRVEAPPWAGDCLLVAER